MSYNVEGQRFSSSVKMTINLGNYESVQLGSEREVSVSGDPTPEEMGKIKYDIFRENLKVLVKSGVTFFREFDRNPVNWFPSEPGQLPPSKEPDNE